jgi:YHYH protein
MRRSTTLLCTCAIALNTALARGHEADEPSSHADSGTSRVTIKNEGDKRIIEANGLPDHKPGQFPNRGNPNSISAQKYHFEMPLKPHKSDEPRPIDRFIFGVAVNGVVFDPGTAEVWRPGDAILSRPGRDTRRGPGDERGHIWNYDAMGKMQLGIDANHAHVQPTGAYHYHGLPTGLINHLRTEKGPAGKDMLLIGYAADGFPIYAESGYEKADDGASPIKKLKPSYHLIRGNRPKGDDGPGGKYDGTFVQDYEFIKGSGDLDECNGRTGVTPEFADGTYYYVVTDSYPFVPRFFRGTPDNSFAKRMGLPPRGPGGPPPGEGPSPRRSGRRERPPENAPAPGE